MLLAALTSQRERTIATTVTHATLAAQSPIACVRWMWCVCMVSIRKLLDIQFSAVQA